MKISGHAFAFYKNGGTIQLEVTNRRGGICL